MYLINIYSYGRGRIQRGGEEGEAQETQPTGEQGQEEAGETQNYE